jgi:hypothetical protein
MRVGGIFHIWNSKGNLWKVLWGKLKWKCVALYKLSSVVGHKLKVRAAQWFSMNFTNCFQQYIPSYYVTTPPSKALLLLHVCKPTMDSNHFLLFHNDAHNYKITGILKQLKFRRSLRHVSVHAGTIIREPFVCLSKTTVMVIYPRRLWRGLYHGSIPICSLHRVPHTRTTGWYAAMTLTTS